MAPGQDPASITIAFEGAWKHLTLDDTTGDLILQTSGGEVRQRKPIIYQEIGRAGDRKSRVATSSSPTTRWGFKWQPMTCRQALDH